MEGGGGSCRREGWFLPMPTPHPHWSLRWSSGRPHLPASAVFKAEPTPSTASFYLMPASPRETRKALVPPAGAGARGPDHPQVPQ